MCLPRESLGLTIREAAKLVSVELARDPTCTKTSVLLPARVAELARTLELLTDEEIAHVGGMVAMLTRGRP